MSGKREVAVPEWNLTAAVPTELLRLNNLGVLWSWFRDEHTPNNKPKKTPQPNGNFELGGRVCSECPSGSCGLSVNDLLCPAVSCFTVPVMTTSCWGCSGVGTGTFQSSYCSQLTPVVWRNGMEPGLGVGGQGWKWNRAELAELWDGGRWKVWS